MGNKTRNKMKVSMNGLRANLTYSINKMKKHIDRNVEYRNRIEVDDQFKEYFNEIAQAANILLCIYEVDNADFEDMSDDECAEYYNISDDEDE